MFTCNGEFMLNANYTPAIVTENYFFMINLLNGSVGGAHHTFWVFGTMM